MLYSYIVEKRIRQTFDHVNNHRWDEAVNAVAPDVHHRVLRHPRALVRPRLRSPAPLDSALRPRPAQSPYQGQQRLGNGLAVAYHRVTSGTALQRCSTGDASYVNRGLHMFTLRWGRILCTRGISRIHKQRPVLLPPKQQLASKKLSPNKL